jgi:hypothetical protein
VIPGAAVSPTPAGTALVQRPSGAGATQPVLITALGRGTSRITAAKGSISDYVDVDVFIKYSSIALGSDWACDAGSIGLVHCWGANARGQFGTGNTTNATTPTWTASSGAPHQRT